MRTAEERRRERDELTLRSRLMANPRPGLRWLAVTLVLVALQFGSLLAGISIAVESTLLALTAIVELLVSVVWVDGANMIVAFQNWLFGYTTGIFE